MELLEKLNWKSGQIHILGMPPGLEAFAGIPSSDTLPEGGSPFILAFVRKRSDLEKIASEVVDALAEDGILWFAYPKKASKRIASDITRDEGWSALGMLGFQPVRQVAIDKDWSALRWRLSVKIRRKDSPSRPAAGD